MAMGRSGDPSAFCCARPSPMKLVEQTVSAALPRFAVSTLSWILHDVQDPQSPEPAMTASASATSSSITAVPRALRCAALAPLDDARDTVLLDQHLREIFDQQIEIGLRVVDKADDFAGEIVQRLPGLPRLRETWRNRFVHEHAA